MQWWAKIGMGLQGLADRAIGFSTMRSQIGKDSGVRKMVPSPRWRESNQSPGLMSKLLLTVIMG